MPAQDNAGSGAGTSSPDVSKGGESEIPRQGDGVRYPHPTRFICDVTHFAGHMRTTVRVVQGWLRDFNVPCWKIGKD